MNTGSALNSQVHLSGFALLCGFLSPSLVSLQQKHYLDISSRRSDTRWACDTSKQLWDMTFQLWDLRCKNLHDSPTILNLHGLPYLKDTVAFEYNLVYSDLPPLYKKYFRPTLPTLLKRPVQHLKRWFLFIRSI